MTELINPDTAIVKIFILILVLGLLIYLMKIVPDFVKEMFKSVIEDLTSDDQEDRIKSSAVAFLLVIFLLLTIDILFNSTLVFITNFVLSEGKSILHAISIQLILLIIFALLFGGVFSSHHYEVHQSDLIHGEEELVNEAERLIE